MNKTYFVPQEIQPISKEDFEKINNVDPKELKNSPAYKKYIQPNIERIKKQKADNRKKWWKNNWLNVATLIVAVLTLIATLLFGVIQLL